MSLSEEQMEVFQRFPDEFRVRMLTMGSDVSLLDDVVQETYITAHRRIDTYDPKRASFMTWLTHIGYNRLNDILREKARNAERVNRAFEAAAVHDTVYALEINQVEMAQDSNDHLDRLASVLGIVRACINDDRLFERSLVLMRECEGDVKLAAAKCGVKASWLRQSHQQVIEMAVVVDGALKIHQRRFEEGDESPVRLGEILSCFPTVSDKTERTWMKTIPQAIVTAGGWSLPRAELVKMVSDQTGYSLVTSRHLVSQCQRLFAVARAVIEHGEVIAGR